MTGGFEILRFLHGIKTPSVQINGPKTPQSGHVMEKTSLLLVLQSLCYAVMRLSLEPANSFVLFLLFPVVFVSFFLYFSFFTL